MSIVVKSRALFVAILGVTLVCPASAADSSAPPPRPHVAMSPEDQDIVAHPVVRTDPSYPVAAYDQKIEGSVTLLVQIGSDGDVIFVQAIKAEPPGYFEAAAIEAAKTWKFRPPGHEIYFTVVIRFKFPANMQTAP